MILNRSEKEQLAQLLAEMDRRIRTRRIHAYYPDTGPLRRELYQKHLAFFEAGKSHRERLFMAGNRVGKTEGAGGVELVYHLTGEYPPWWNGRLFTHPVDVWVAGTSGKTTRDIIQAKLFGEKGKFGEGLIPLDKIEGKPTAKAGVADAFDTALIKHKSGGTSILQFKSFDQGRPAFEGTKKHIIWLDEEPPLDVYLECLLRTTDTTGMDTESGMIMLTFTPLEGMSETVLQFLPGGQIAERAEGSKFVVMASWDDVPHISAKTKEELLAAIPPYQRDARTKGIPQLGSGAIYQVPESDFVVPDFELPPHWPRVYGTDVGWNRTAGAWLALDRDTDTIYVYAEYYRGQAEPSVHATGIKAKGDWIPGVIDPAARGRSQVDGSKLMDLYRGLGLDLEPANNSVESGIYQIWERMSAGKFKVFKSCQNWLGEYRLYRRDEKGHIVKQADHLMDATRYGVVSGLARAKVKPVPTVKRARESRGPGGWMG